MTAEDKRNMVVLALLAWWLWNRPEVTTEISYPEAPADGNCYDYATDSYYVGDCY